MRSKENRIEQLEERTGVNKEPVKLKLTNRDKQKVGKRIWQNLKAVYESEMPADIEEYKKLSDAQFMAHEAIFRHDDSMVRPAEFFNDLVEDRMEKERAKSKEDWQEACLPDGNRLTALRKLYNDLIEAIKREANDKENQNQNA